MGDGGMRLRKTLAMGAAVALAASVAAGCAPKKEGLPTGARDFSGVWDNNMGLNFDPATADPKGNSAQGLRDRSHPPYNAEWEAKYQAELDEHVKMGTIQDPLNYCQPHGFPRILGGAPGPLEILQVPGKIYLMWEYMSQIHRIYMDRPMPPDDQLWPQTMGVAIGHWEGDTLVVQVKGMKAGQFDRTGAPFSESISVVERIRKLDDNTLENQITITDPVAFTKPWVVTRKWERADPGTRVGDLFCDSDRNPIVNGQVQTVLGSEALIPGTPEHEAAARGAAQARAQSNPSLAAPPPGAAPTPKPAPPPPSQSNSEL